MENFDIILLFSFIGFAFTSVGVYEFLWNRKIEKKGIKTKAEIIDYSEEKSKHSEDNSIIFYPILRFTDRNGLVVTQKHSSGEEKKIDSKFIEIYYLKEDNDYKILINTSFWKTYFPLWSIIFGLIFIAFAAAIGIKHYSQQHL